MLVGARAANVLRQRPGKLRLGDVILAFARHAAWRVKRGDHREFIGRKALIVGNSIRGRAVRSIKCQLAFDDISARCQLDRVIVVGTTGDQRSERGQARKCELFHRKVDLSQ